MASMIHGVVVPQSKKAIWWGSSSFAAWRAARAMGYHKLITYILDTEPGTSLRAAGWKCVGQAGGLRWTGKRRPEVDLCPAQMKLRWEIGDEAALEEEECME